MDANSNNPPTNILPPGTSSDQVEEAIKRSGYPLQTVVASQLQSYFFVAEEWSFLDRETKSLRALDIFAYKKLDHTLASESGIFPSLVLLVECKRSELPYIFFKSASQKDVPEFPSIQALRSDEIFIKSSTVSRYFPISDCLGLKEEAFIGSGPILCTTFSKTVRKGSSLELSGSDPFNNVVLPLVNAIDHAFAYYKLSHRQDTYYPKLVLGVCVVDAPMIVADASIAPNTFTLAPWVRIVRHEVKLDVHGERVQRHYAVDIVHYGYLKQFIENHVLPFANVFAERVIKQKYILSDLEGYVRDIDSWKWEEVSSQPIK